MEKFRSIRSSPPRAHSQHTCDDESDFSLVWLYSKSGIELLEIITKACCHSLQEGLGDPVPPGVDGYEGSNSQLLNEWLVTH